MYIKKTAVLSINMGSLGEDIYILLKSFLLRSEHTNYLGIKYVAAKKK